MRRVLTWLDVAARYAIIVAASAWGYLLREEHRRTFDPVDRQSDFANTLAAVERVIKSHAVSWAGDDLHNGYHGPLWYRLAAELRGADDAEAPRRMAVLSVWAFALRQAALLVGMRAVYPEARWAAVVALTLHAALPVGAYQDGIAYNEALHAALFTIALFALCRIERDGPRRASLGVASLFGFVSGVALLTKASAAVLPAAAAVLALSWWRDRPAMTDLPRRVGALALAAAVPWTLAAGWWCLRNLASFGAPLPHQYDVRLRAVIANHPAVLDPLSYHRPLGWYLPFDPRFFFHPFASWSRQNFWGEMFAGTWADTINHGMCRLPERSGSLYVWRNLMSDACVDAGRRLVAVGTGLTALAAVGCVALLVRRSPFEARRVVIPAVVALTTALLMAFGTRFTFDHHPVIKAAYALHLAPPLCVAIGLLVAGDRDSNTPARRVSRTVATALTLAAIAVVARWLHAEVYGRMP